MAIETHWSDFIENLQKSGIDGKRLEHIMAVTHQSLPIYKQQIMKHAVKVEEKKAD